MCNEEIYARDAYDSAAPYSGRVIVSEIVTFLRSGGSADDALAFRLSRGAASCRGMQRQLLGEETLPSAHVLPAFALFGDAGFPSFFQALFASLGLALRQTGGTGLVFARF